MSYLKQSNGSDTRPKTQSFTVEYKKKRAFNTDKALHDLYMHAVDAEGFKTLPTLRSTLTRG